MIPDYDGLFWVFIELEGLNPSEAAEGSIKLGRQRLRGMDALREGLAAQKRDR